MDDCPCGNNFPYTDCCGPLIRETSFADTAEDLMRSRFTAYVKKNWSYLLKTIHPDERKQTTEKEISDGQEEVVWNRLEVLASQSGRLQDEEGEVTFVATYNEKGIEKSLQESSRFIKENGRWYYSPKNSQSKILAPDSPPPATSKPFIREKTKIGRNAPCPCGSGKKYKKCCGR